MGGHMTYLEQAESIEACQRCGKDFDVSTMPKNFLDNYALCYECRIQFETGEVDPDTDPPDLTDMDAFVERLDSGDY